MRVEVYTTEYQFSHGHAPRGTGCWAFEIKGEVVFIPGMKTYSQARREASQIAEGRGAYSMKVCP